MTGIVQVNEMGYSMSRTLRRTAALACAALVATLPAITTAGARSSSDTDRPAAEHVLLLSVDGLHQSDLEWYVAHFPTSALAALVRGGTEYRNASTPFPSDSFPGMIAQVSGGNPRTAGVYYDDSYNRRLLPAGTTDCSGVVPGAEVALAENLDKDVTRIDAGQGLSGLPDSILHMTGHPLSVIDRSQLPVDPKTCRPVLPNQYLQTNTIFDVAYAHGMRTAWSDKHPACQILNGPNRLAIADEFTPEINSAAIGYPAGDDWTNDNAATQQYDGYKVHAVLNQIDGYDHSRSHRVGEPAIFGMNFQSVSTAQKLPTSNGRDGGYLPGGTVPGPVLRGALRFVDSSVGAMVSELYGTGHAHDTTIILSAKHGQSPTQPEALRRVDDGAIIDAINAGWTQSHPGAQPLVAFSVDDDLMLLWLSNRSSAATSYVKSYLLSHSAAANTIGGSATSVGSSGLRRVAAGAAAANLFGVAVPEPRHPDIIGLVQHGVVYTGKMSKIAEHGGNDAQDRHVPILVVGAGVARGMTVSGAVETTRIAPTILRLLGLDPHQLRSVRIEGTRALPELYFPRD